MVSKRDNVADLVAYWFKFMSPDHILFKQQVHKTACKDVGLNPGSLQDRWKII